MSGWQDFHAAVQVALADPLEADCSQLCRVMDQCLSAMSEADCLSIGGTAIALIAEVLFLKMQGCQQTAVLEKDSELEAEDYEGFPILDQDDDLWERHTMSLDLDEDEEDWGRIRTPRSRSKSGSTAAAIPPKQISKWLRDLAGDDDPGVWSTAIAEWLNQQTGAEPIPVSMLQKSILLQVLEPEKSVRPLSIVELWMGLLLGKFTLLQTQSSEDEFYRELSDSSIMLIPNCD